MNVLQLSLTGGILVAALTANARADARTDYLLHCGGCHLENGAGAPPEVPDLRVNLRLFASSDGSRSYLARVPGSAQAPISDERLSSVLNWMLDTYVDPATEAKTKDKDIRVRPYSAAEVQVYRADLLLDPLEERSKLLESLRSPAQTF